MFGFLIAVATAFLPSPHIGSHDALPYDHPGDSCYGIYRRLTDDVETKRRRYDYVAASRIAVAASRQIALCLSRSATVEQQDRYRYSSGRSLWIAGEDAYASGDRERACALVARGWQALTALVPSERDRKRRIIVSDWIDQARSDLRGNWLSWWVAGGIRTPIRNDRACVQNVPNNPTRPWSLYGRKSIER